MHFYVDETGQTGRNLFDKTQPILSYGVLSSEADLDKVAEADLAALRKTLGVERLHAAELGVHRLSEVVDTLLVLQKNHRIRFDIWQVVKRDHAIISFFDCVFRSIRSRICIEVRSAIRILSINRELNFFYRFLTRFFDAFHYRGVFPQGLSLKDQSV